MPPAGWDADVALEAGDEASARGPGTGEEISQFRPYGQAGDNVTQILTVSKRKSAEAAQPHRQLIRGQTLGTTAEAANKICTIWWFISTFVGILENALARNTGDV